MNRIFTLTLIVICLFLSGCNDAKSIKLEGANYIECEGYEKFIGQEVEIIQGKYLIIKYQQYSNGVTWKGIIISPKTCKIYH